MKALHKIALGAAMLMGASLATAAPAAAQSFGFSVGGPGYSVHYGYPGYPGYYGYGYGRPYYYDYRPYYGYYERPYRYSRSYYGRPYHGRPYRGYRR